MLPPGHIAAGYLTAKVYLRYAHYQLSPKQEHLLLMWGALSGFIPDLDTFAVFILNKSLTFKDKKVNHRNFVSHAPVLWLIAGLIIFYFAQNPFYKVVGILLWLGSWSHFFLDTLEYGIMWLWPFTNRIFAFSGRQQDITIEPSSSFIGYWRNFVKGYFRQFFSSYLELLIIIVSLIALLH